MAHGLEAILEPRSIAIVGASRNPRKRGFQAVRALRDSGFRGAIHPVHPAGGELLGFPVAPSVEALDDAPDLAFVCTRAESVPAILQACARKGIRGAVVPAVGFGESGPAGAELERAVSQIARRTGLRVVGPNTSGVLNTALGLNLVGVPPMPAGRLALLAQSGNVGLALMTEAAARSQGVSVYVGVGNEADVAFHEYLEYLEADPRTAAVLIYAEGFRDGRRFLDTARRVTVEKPIVLLKGGRSPRGDAAARSHTGAIAGSYQVLRAVLRPVGVVEVTRSDELLAVGETLAGQPPVPAGKGVAVLSDGGGHGTLAADRLAELDVPLAELAPETRKRLRGLLGSPAGVENPVDLAGAADRDPGIVARALEVIARDPAVGGVLVVGLFGGYALRFAEDLVEEEVEAAEAMASLMTAVGKPLVVHSLYAAAGPEPLRRLMESGVVVVGSLEVASRCVGAAWARGVFLRRQAPPSAPSPPPRRTEPPGLALARAEGRSTLTEPEARELVAAHGVPVAPATFCETAAEAVEAARRAGGPVAVKAVSAGVPHKTEAGGVALDVSGVDGAAAAFGRVMAAVTAHVTPGKLGAGVPGALVAPMLPAPVAELIVGVRRDPSFGPVLLVGAGGVAAELHQDAAVRCLPVDRQEILEMMREIRLARVMEGFRGGPSVDWDSLVDLVARLAACAAAHPDIVELEANPVFAYYDRAVAVDVRALLDSRETRR
ncbi:MAG TPA: acetate--CoA ligase family protein [Gemmatimonadota bacterium]|nr:acetate--CoA ligase family protein [Gemmatimonadota bacterium]